MIMLEGLPIDAQKWKVLGVTCSMNAEWARHFRLYREAVDGITVSIPQSLENSELHNAAVHKGS
jgi:hypothetical protein